MSLRFLPALAGSLLLLLALAGCGDDDGGGCNVSTDCASGEVCVDGVCQMATDGGDCSACAPGSACVNGMCIAPDAGGSDGAIDVAAMCEDCDGVCIAGVCCEEAQACGDACCGEGDLCSFGSCVTPGDACRSEDDCADGEYCEPRLAEAPLMCDGAPVTSGRCLPRPPRCPDGTVPDPESPECIAECVFEPAAEAFDMVLRYAWGEFDGDREEPNPHDIRNSPIVIQLDDDDCDGVVTARDIPEIVVMVSPTEADRGASGHPRGDLVALSVTAGELTEKFRVVDAGSAWTYPAAGEIDGNPGNEIVICDNESNFARLYGVTADGTDLELLWRSIELKGRCNSPSLADFNQDGVTDVLVGGTILDGRTGMESIPSTTNLGSLAVSSDLDGDGDLEIIVGGIIFHLVGGMYEEFGRSGLSATYSIVADLEAGDNPEIVSVHGTTRELHVWRIAEDDATVEVVRSGLNINGSIDPTRCADPAGPGSAGGGPPTAADVNGDGVPDIAVAGRVSYIVLDGSGLVNAAVADADTFIWERETRDCSSGRTGSSVFDFNGDGRAEVLYGDERTFYVYDGQTSDVLFETCNTNGTIIEYPVVADVDNDGQADVVVVSNARYFRCVDDSDPTSGVRVFSSEGGNFVRTRRVWNQHAYHVTNVGEDGTIPMLESPNWNTPGLNNFRQNIQPGGELVAPDAVVSTSCSSSSGEVIATVRNLGEGVLPAGAIVRVFQGAEGDGGAMLGMAMTRNALFPAQAEDVVVPVTDTGVATGADPSHTTVESPATAIECRPDNNTAGSVRAGCLI